jgi:predicted nucleic acid-binding protein
LSLVIDASVAGKWIFPDEASEAADALLDDNDELLAPDLIYFEIGNVVWKRISRGKLDLALGFEVLEEFAKIPIVTGDIRSIGASALRIAAGYGRTFYDSSYLALALARGCELVTADERLFNSLRHTELEGVVRLL